MGMGFTKDNDEVGKEGDEVGLYRSHVQIQI